MKNSWRTFVRNTFKKKNQGDDSAQLSSIPWCRLLLAFTIFRSFNSVAKISFAGTPEISSNFFKDSHVDFDLSSLHLKPNQKHAARPTRRGRPLNRPQQIPKALQAVCRAPCSPSIPSFVHQWMNTQVATLGSRNFTLLDRANSRLVTELTSPVVESFVNCFRLEEFMLFFWVVAPDCVLETQVDDEEEETEERSESAEEFREQEGQRAGRGGGEEREKRFFVTELHWEQRITRRWRATRKFAWWTLTSHWKQRKAESDGQNRAAWSLQSSQSLEDTTSSISGTWVVAVEIEGKEGMR